VACGGSPEIHADDDDPVDVENPIVRVACEDPLGGIPLSPGLVEDAPDFETRLAALDLERLPATIALDNVDGFFLATLAWSLEMPVASLEGGLDRDTLLAGGPMEHAVLGAFATEVALDDGGLDFAFLRQGIHRFHGCQQGAPNSISEFKRAYGSWTSDDGSVITSQPKAGPRRLITLPPQNGITVYVAETLVDPILFPDAVDGIRETEIIIEGARDDGALAFFVYDSVGALSSASSFATRNGGTVETSTPYTCLVCHFSSSSVPRFDVVHPD